MSRILRAADGRSAFPPCGIAAGSAQKGASPVPTTVTASLTRPAPKSARPKLLPPTTGYPTRLLRYLVWRRHIRGFDCPRGRRW